MAFQINISWDRGRDARTKSIDNKPVAVAGGTPALPMRILFLKDYISSVATFFGFNFNLNEYVYICSS